MTFRLTILGALLILVLVPVDTEAQSAHAIAADEPGVPLSDDLTAEIVENIRAVRSECATVPARYWLDCLRLGLDLTSRKIPFHGVYGPARLAMQRGATSLARIVVRFSDKGSPRLEMAPGSNPRFASRRYFAALDVVSAEEARSKAFETLVEIENQLAEALSEIRELP